MVAYAASGLVWAVDVYLLLSLLLGYASHKLFKRYWLVGRHWLNLLNLFFAGGILLAAGTNPGIYKQARFRAAIGYLAFFKWMWFLDQIRLIEPIGMRVLPITTTMLSVVPFSGVLLVCVLGAANMLFALDMNARSFMECFVEMYHLTVLGEVDLEALTGDTNPIQRIEWLTVIMTFLIYLVLTNLFIAVLCHSYEIAAKRARQDLVRNRAASVLEQFAIREGIRTTFCPQRARLLRSRRRSLLQRVESSRSLQRMSNSSTSNTLNSLHKLKTSKDISIHEDDAFVWVATDSSKED